MAWSRSKDGLERVISLLMASGQIAMRKIDGWRTLPTKPLDQQIDLAS